MAGKKKKDKMLFEVDYGKLFCFAGLFENWKSSTDEWVRSATIITTDCNELVSSVHDRMPVILPRDAYGLWLDPSSNKDMLLDMLRPFPTELMSMEMAAEYDAKAAAAPGCDELSQ